MRYIKEELDEQQIDHLSKNERVRDKAVSALLKKSFDKHGNFH